MRACLEAAFKIATAAHFGLAYDLLGPVPGPGGVDPRDRDRWLDRCVRHWRCDPDYRQFFERVQNSFPATQRRIVVTTSRLLVGHGNRSGGELGLTVHHSWGVPVIPGSALKGLLAHHVDAVRGDDPDWTGPVWDGPRLVAPPGRHYRALFGSPANNRGENATAGGVIFHDALWQPGPNPFVRDVLTPHQSEYHAAAGCAFPNDWTTPVPVPFISVGHGTRFLIAITAAAGWEAWAGIGLGWLLDALDTWGVGGKTSAGYGRLRADGS